MNNGDLPANPLVNENGHPFHETQVCFDNTQLTIGLTKREAFAMAAMQGFLSTETGCNTPNNYIAERSIDLADALLKELAKCQ